MPLGCDRRGSLFGVSEGRASLSPDSVLARLSDQQYRWLVTGSAGFIGSHLVEALLRLGQTVVSLDNFSTGHRANLEQVRDAVGDPLWRNHTFIEGDICAPEVCRRACRGADFVLHQAALGSVPRSILDPIATNASNVTGFLNVLVAAKEASVRRIVYAASSATYGDHPNLPKVEDTIGSPLSPYAVTKYVNELYAAVFARCYATESIGLRYFNVFGSRQDPDGPYAAVIPRWIRAMLTGGEVTINGDGETTRDFCHVRNAVQSNLLAALTVNADAVNQIYNIAVGSRTSLIDLFGMLRLVLAEQIGQVRSADPVFHEFRQGDVRHSQADISKARLLLGYEPSYGVLEGLREAVPWFIRRFSVTNIERDVAVERH
jgi:UDP-N-acetylglucosamine 4-epimerase